MANSNRLVIDKGLVGIYTKVFDSAEGKRVLEDLMMRFHTLDGVVSSDEERSGKPIDPYDVLMKVGQQQVVLHILSCVEGNKVGRFREMTAKSLTPR